MRACLGFFKSLLQDVVYIVINLVQLLLLDVALSKQAVCVLLVGVLVSTNCLHPSKHPVPCIDQRPEHSVVTVLALCVLLVRVLSY